MGDEPTYQQHDTFWAPQTTSNPPESCWSNTTCQNWPFYNSLDHFNPSPAPRECETVPSPAFISAMMNPESTTFQMDAYTQQYSSYEEYGHNTSANASAPTTQYAAPAPHVPIRFFTSTPTYTDQNNASETLCASLEDPNQYCSVPPLPTRLGSSLCHGSLYSTLEQDKQPVGDYSDSSDPSSRCDTPTILNESTGSLSDSNSISDSESDSENDFRPPSLNRLLYRSARLRGALVPDTQRPPSSRVAKPVKKLCDVPFVSRFTVNKCRKRSGPKGSKRPRKGLPADVASPGSASEVDLATPKEWTFVEVVLDLSRMSPSVLNI